MTAELCAAVPARLQPGDTVFVNLTDGKLELSLEPEPMSVH